MMPLLLIFNTILFRKEAARSFPSLHISFDRVSKGPRDATEV